MFRIPVHFVEWKYVSSRATPQVFIFLLFLLFGGMYNAEMYKYQESTNKNNDIANN